jgi:hypothetical protein
MTNPNHTDPVTVDQQRVVIDSVIAENFRLREIIAKFEAEHMRQPAASDEPVALLHQHPDYPPELELYRHGSGCLTKADKAAGWTETPLYAHHPAQPAASDEPVAVIRFDKGTPGNENEMPKVISCNWMPDGEYRVFLTAQPHPSDDVREALQAALQFACLTLAFIGRDQGTERINRTLDGLCKEAVKLEAMLRPLTAQAKAKEASSATKRMAETLGAEFKLNNYAAVVTKAQEAGA